MFEGSNVKMSEDSEIAETDECDDAVGDALYKTLKNSGFNFLIEFEELLFDFNKDFIGSGTYGEVFIGKWLGVKIAIKRFVKIYNNKKVMSDFVKEIEVLHSLRHPSIILYMGISFDQNS